jgi:copper resistance protein B
MGRLLFLISTLFLLTSSFAEEISFGSISSDRMEWQFDTDTLLFDLEGIYGTDEHRFVAKLEGEKSDGHGTRYDAQFLYSKAFSPFFDLQLGLAVEDHGSDTTTGLVAGFEGLARYRIELEAYATLTEDGDVLLHSEFERDFLLSQKLVLQPRLELAAALSDVGPVDAGFSDLALEIRVLYEVNRKFAPYAGISWQRAFGDTGRLLELAGEDENVTTALLGVSFWF